MKSNIKIVTLFATICALSPMATLAQDKINVALGDVSLNKVAFLIAEDNGIYEKYDLDVHQFITKGAADRISRSGVNVPPDFVGTPEESSSAHISIGGGSPLIYSMTTRPDSTQRIIVATTDNTATFHIIADDALRSEDDLLGKKLGFSSVGSVSNTMAREYLRQKGWEDGKDITLVEEGMDFARLTAGEVDAFIGSSIYFTMAGENGAHSLVDLSDFDIPLAGSSVNVETKWYADNRDITVRFVKSMIEAYALMLADYEVFSAVLEKWYGITDEAQARGMYAETEGWELKPYPAVAGIALLKELYDHEALQSRTVESFYDDSIIRELDESGFIDAAYAEAKAK